MCERVAWENVANDIDAVSKALKDTQLHIDALQAGNDAALYSLGVFVVFWVVIAVAWVALGMYVFKGATNDRR